MPQCASMTGPTRRARRHWRALRRWRLSSSARGPAKGWTCRALNFTDVIHQTPINQDGLVSAVAAANPHSIVVMENGGAQVLPWLASVSAVLEAWFPGQRGGEAIANILFGAVNPSGKLPESG